MQIQEFLRPLIFAFLRGRTRITHTAHYDYSVPHIHGMIADEARKNNYMTDGNTAWIDGQHGRILLHPRVQVQVNDIIQDLVIEGILRVGHAIDPEWHAWPNIHLTPYGILAVSNPSTPHDTDGYLKQIRSKIPNPDQIILDYIEESAITLRHNCLLSSTVALGNASERTFLLLVDAFHAALAPSNKPQYEKDVVGQWMMKPKHAKFKEWYENRAKAKLKGDKGNDWLSSFDDALISVFSYFRVMRNDAGHPSGKKLDKEVVQSHLSIFPHYLRLMYDAMEWFANHSGL